jgi:signal transduction histidine kinase
LIEGYAEALKDGIASDEETRNEYCDIIIDEAGKMNTMVKQLLTINQIETGRSEIDIERFDIVKMIMSLSLWENRVAASPPSPNG